ncbi:MULTISPECIES: GGDEF domain-containing response regulator [Pseudoalteromonas]|nr:MULTISPECIES: GGDEF domain-containing response regulator [Pseudoalteromonas]MDN3395770.1 EAL domain-containing protein [Pseudoalteromonas sp. APC 3215]MDN3402589.1 EAL domain-containing protein [Pseudoalteromonas sp. APC 3213]MDN3404766.1 EAL domain-containing protein [Pseudoalteromonas sp. APC 3218]MDN3407698.1 EAL domain-containing protein [Pseudoalteromonas sp. APC 3894]MDN3415337.1 EAL domain-containing protein [Pseudoalteromonas sp. APC 3227]
MITSIDNFETCDSINLLIVDDDAVDREQIRRMISRSNIQAKISEASSIESSMSYLEHGEFDCVIVDYRLGIGSGLTLLNNIRKTENNHCAVIMITGLGDEKIAAEAMRLGASDYLLKNQLKSDQLIHSISSSIQRANLEKKLHDMAHYDSLTGLASRPILIDQLQQAITSEQKLAVAYLDLDNFKPINDKYGHETGDFVLKTIAQRLKSTLRKEDTLARIGGDEFIFLLRGAAHTIQEYETLLQEVLIEVNDPIKLAEFSCSVQISVSIGVALPSDDGLTCDDILRRADQTMYQAKRSGTNRILFFDPEEESLRHAKHDLLLAAEKGIARKEFILHYQPKVNLMDHQLIGVEALIRWNHPTLGLLYPGHFSEALEHPHIGILIGEWVLAEALKQHKIWTRNHLSMSVNISPAHLLSEGFVENLRELLISTNNIKPKTLELEILESTTIGNVDQAVDVLNGCRDLGVSIALDDFGTGYASLSYLKKLPLDTLKIDQSFVKKLLSDHEDKSIVTCIVALSKAFGYNLVAEGIESQELEKVLIGMGCYHGQGYYIAKPMSAEKMNLWIKNMTSTKH